MSNPETTRRPGRMHGPNAGMNFEKAKHFKQTLKRLVSYIAFQKIPLLIVILCTIGAVVLNILGPSVLGKAVSSIARIPFDGIEPVYRKLAIALSLYAGNAILTFVAGFVAARVSQVVVYRLRSELKDKLDKLPLKYFDGTTHGEILSRMTNDIETVSMTLQQSVTQVVNGACTFIGVLIMMFYYSWILALVMLLTIPIFLAISMTVMKHSQGQFKAQQRELGELNSKIEEYFNGAKETKLFNRERQSTEDFEVSNHALEKTGIRAQTLSGMIMPSLNLVSYLGYVLVCVIGGLLYGRNLIGLEGITSYMMYQKQFSQPITQTAQIANILQSGIAAAERVFEIFDQQEDEDAGREKLERDAVQGAVDFENISFRYVADVPLINDLSLHANPGDTVAIVGPTGAGKTTLVNLLMRFYEIGGGSIRIDGTDISAYPKSELRSLYGMVLQDTWLFTGTIRDNIKFGKSDATDEEMIDAAKRAHIHHYIMTLPHGYDTEINENATNISQGQKQLLTIARAMLKNPKILILDEATSSVDTRTEVLIQKAMNEMMTGRTSFVIAHRLSTIKKASTIIVMNHGSVVEQGTHEELLEKKGFYADLYNAQFAHGAAEGQ